ncbi:hypothetical protein [Variovorax paradoxus]|uniref:hypothetical protein n=1 Tax=Variovorax paradoxus TaxID=34073 RepID=UPI001ABCE7F9
MKHKNFPDRAGIHAELAEQHALIQAVMHGEEKARVQCGGALVFTLLRIGASAEIRCDAGCTKYHLTMAPRRPSI